MTLREFAMKSWAEWEDCGNYDYNHEASNQQSETEDHQSASNQKSEDDGPTYINIIHLSKL